MNREIYERESEVSPDGAVPAFKDRPTHNP
jgi:hypothetical protein